MNIYTEEDAIDMESISTPVIFRQDRYKKAMHGFTN